MNGILNGPRLARSERAMAGVIYRRQSEKAVDYFGKKVVLKCDKCRLLAVYFCDIVQVELVGILSEICWDGEVFDVFDIEFAGINGAI